MSSAGETPFIDVEGVPNFRSIGGYPTTANNTPLSPTSQPLTRHNFIYRSAEPRNITPAGRSQVKSLGITTVFDLRSQPEVAKTGTAVIADDIHRRFTPVFAEEDWSPESIIERHAAYADSSGTTGYVRAYTEMLERGGDAFREILLHVRDRPDDVFLCHCSAGKDRTGVMIAILLKIAGCADEVVAREYELTEVGLAGRKEAIVQYLMMKQGWEGTREKAEKVAAAKYENMLATLEMIEEKYGGVEKYVEEYCGLTPEDIAIIRGHLLSPDSTAVS